MGGIHSAEALLFARYFMYKQVYFHSIRRIYDIHLRDFYKAWLGDDHVISEPEKLLPITDNEVNREIRRASDDQKYKGHQSANCIWERKHFKVLYEMIQKDFESNEEITEEIFELAKEEFGDENIRMDDVQMSTTDIDFPVLCRDERVLSVRSISQTIPILPSIAIECVYIESSLYEKAMKWKNNKLNDILGLDRRS